MNVATRIRIGFSGSRQPPTEEQVWQLGLVMGTIMQTARQVELNQPPVVLHHGDCVGSDAQAHLLGRQHGYWIVSHPPISNIHRAGCRADQEMPPKEYLDRNQDIAKACDFLIITPEQEQEQFRGSGTWATKRYAVALKKRVLVIYPNGNYGWLPR